MRHRDIESTEENTEPRQQLKHEGTKTRNGVRTSESASRLRVFVVNPLLISLCSLCLCVAFMVSRAEARPASAPSRDVVPVLVEQGVAALDAGDARAARDAFLDASSVDAANVTALHGSGLAYLKLGLPKRAAPQLERAYAAAHGQPPRNPVITLAAALVATANPMRAARVVQDYLQKTPAPDDEAADALAIALENADEQARHGKVWESANAFAKAYATKLAPRHPGMKRWGARWLPASEVDTLETQVRTQQATVARVKKDLAAAERDVAAHQAKLDALQRTGH